MNRCKGLSLLMAGTVLFSVAGCQLGKMSMPSLSMPNLSMPKVSMPEMKMPKLAWWKKDSREKLSDDFIEPPSYQFSPSNASGDSEKSESETIASNLPSKQKPYSMDSDELRSSTEPAADRSRTLDAFKSDLANAYEQLSASSPSSKDGTQRSLTNSANQINNSRGGQFAVQQPYPNQNARSATGGLQPRFSNSASPSTQSPTGSGMPPTTRYEEIARRDAASQSSFGALSPGTSNGSGSSGETGRIQNPYTQTPTASAIPSEPGDGSSQLAGYDQYPTTPHKEFVPRDELINATVTESARRQTPSSKPAPTTTAPTQTNGADEDSSADNFTQVPSTTNSSVPGNLLKGQGTYAPGSVSPLQPMTPAEVTSQKTPGGDIGYGGSFQPN